MYKKIYVYEHGHNFFKKIGNQMHKQKTNIDLLIGAAKITLSLNIFLTVTNTSLHKRLLT